MADRYFHDGPLAPGPVVLTGPDAHHLGRVLRAGPGSRVTLFNGDGSESAAVVTAVGKRFVELDVTAVERPARELTRRIVAAAAVPKGDRGDFLLEKLVELGVAEFVPLATARGVVKPGDGRVDKWRRAVVEASKQCGRNVLMAVTPVTDWTAFLARADIPAERRVAHFGGADWAGVETDVAFAVGPEGGFTGDEIGRAVERGWKVCGLGPRVLRVETAAVALAARLSIGQ